MCSHILSIVNTAAVNIGCIYLQISIFVFFGKIPQSVIAGLHGNSIFNFMSNLHTVLHSSCINLSSQQQYTWVPFLHILTKILYVFLTTVILTGVMEDISFWFSLIISEVEHLFMCLLAVCISSLKNIYSSPLPIF